MQRLQILEDLMCEHRHLQIRSHLHYLWISASFPPVGGVSQHNPETFTLFSLSSLLPRYWLTAFLSKSSNAHITGDIIAALHSVQNLFPNKPPVSFRTSSN